MAKTMRAADRRKMTSGTGRGEHVEKLAYDGVRKGRRRQRQGITY